VAGARPHRARSGVPCLRRGPERELRGEGAELRWQATGEDGRSLPLKHLFFDTPQVVRINANGVAEPAALALHQRGRARTLQLNGWLEDGL